MTTRKKIALISSTVLITLLVLCIAAYFVVGGFFYDVALNPKSKIANERFGAMDTSKQLNKKEWFENESGKFAVKVNSYDNLQLNGFVIPAKSATNDWAIIVHGYRGSSGKMTDYAYNYSLKGYNVLTPDLRGHGESEGNYIGMGWHDRLDIITWINYLISLNNTARIMLHGVSMGAATVMMTTGEPLPKNVIRAVADCGYTSAYEQFLYVAQNQLQLPKWPIMSSAATLAKMKASYNLKDASSVEQLKKSTTPTLFIHGNKDGFVPFFMQDIVFNACSAPKEKLVVDGASHALSSSLSPELYWQTVWDFSTRYN